MSGFWIVIGLLYLLGFCQSSASPATQDVEPDATSDDTQEKDKETILLLTEHERLVLLQNGKEIYSQSLPDLKLPKISAIYKTATMEVVNNTAYIGGFDGTVYQVNISMNTTGVSVNVSTIELNLPCIAEVFTSNGASVITACFGHKNNTLYVVNVHSPTERSELNFTSASDFSNILAFDNVFYYAQNNSLYQGNTSHQRVIETFQNCLQPLLTKHKSCCIIIQCSDKSHVFVPPELGSLPGKRNGTWEDKKIYPCHGNGSAPLIFTANKTEITIFDIRNDFKSTIILNGAPEVSTITCAWSNNDLVLFYKENFACNCWIRYTMNNNFEFKHSTEVLLSQGTLHPLSTSKGDIDQSVLIFYPDVLRFLMLPSENQVMVDLKTGFFYTNITNNVVLYHNMIFESSKADGGETGKKGSTDNPTKKSQSWTVYLGVVATVLIMSISVIGIVSYCYLRRQRHFRHRSGLDIAVRIPLKVADEDSPNHAQETDQAHMASSIV